MSSCLLLLLLTLTLTLTLTALIPLIEKALDVAIDRDNIIADWRKFMILVVVLVEDLTGAVVDSFLQLMVSVVKMLFLRFLIHHLIIVWRPSALTKNKNEREEEGRDWASLYGYLPVPVPTGT